WSESTASPLCQSAPRSSTRCTSKTSRSQCSQSHPPRRSPTRPRFPKRCPAKGDGEPSAGRRIKRRQQRRPTRPRRKCAGSYSKRTPVFVGGQKELRRLSQSSFQNGISPTSAHHCPPCSV